MLMVFQILEYLLTITIWVIIVQAVLSWLISFNIINTQNEFVRSIWKALNTMTEPLYRPVRKILPDFGALDLSPMVVLILINILQRFVLPGLFLG